MGPAKELQWQFWTFQIVNPAGLVVGVRQLNTGILELREFD